MKSQSRGFLYQTQERIEAREQTNNCCHISDRGAFSRSGTARSRSAGASCRPAEIPAKNADANPGQSDRDSNEEGQRILAKFGEKASVRQTADQAAESALIDR